MGGGAGNRPVSIVAPSLQGLTHLNAILILCSARALQSSACTSPLPASQPTTLTSQMLLRTYRSMSRKDGASGEAVCVSQVSMLDPTSDTAELALLAIPPQPMQLQSVGGDLAGEVSPLCPLCSWLETTMLEGTGTASCIANYVYPNQKAKKKIWKVEVFS